MKLHSLVLSVLLISSVQAFAQDGRLSTSGNLRKPTLSNYQLSPIVSYSNTGYNGVQGINGGQFKDLSFPSGGVGLLIGKGRWQFDTGLIYTTVGSEFTFSNSQAGIRIQSQSSYLDIPVLARWTFMGDRRYRAFVRGGAVAGILVDSKVDATAYTTTGMNISENYKDAFHNLDARVLLGFGGSYRLTTTMTVAGSVDYQEGVTKLTNNNLYDGYDVHSRSLGVSISLGIRI